MITVDTEEEKHKLLSLCDAVLKRDGMRAYEFVQSILAAIQLTPEPKQDE